MSRAKLGRFLDLRYCLAIAAGILWALAFPKFNLAGGAWVAPGLLLFAAAGCTARKAFWIGYLAGFAHYLAGLYWLLFIPFPSGAVLGWLALSAYLALYPAVWVVFCWKLFPLQLSGVGNAETRSLLRNVMSVGWVGRSVWAVVCAASWVGLEMILARLFTGFPWDLLGVSQFQNIPLIQVASLTGVYGVSFLLVWFSICLGFAVFRVFHHPQPRWVWAFEIGVPLGVVLVLIAFGMQQIRNTQTPSRFLKVAMVQPSIPQRVIFDPNESGTRFRQLIDLTKQALASKPDLLLWPEASLPDFQEENLALLTNLVRQSKVWMIFGADDAELVSNSGPKPKYKFFNTAFLLGPDGRFVQRYHKRGLVIFGEYIPLARWLPFTKYFTPIESSFTPGDGPVPFIITSPKAKLYPLICFEDVFPHLAREYVDRDTDLLVNLTNNGWFGESAAQWQHAATAVFRAVENRIPLVRCTNNGLTCWIDSEGRLNQVYFEESQDVYKAGFKTANVPLLPSNGTRQLTIYRQYGDWFGWACLCLALVGGALSFRPVRPQRSSLQPF